MKKALKWTLRIVAVLVLVLIVGGLGIYFWAKGQIRDSLPRTEGEVALEGLAGAVTVERDALGVPTIRGESRRDVARATGFVHAQERFFQMDLLRRNSAGELAELIGPAMLAQDRRIRVHRFRPRAEALLSTLPEDHRALLKAYTEGVNAGLADLGAKPFEYLFLRTEPQPWQAHDSLLVVYSMFLDLQRGDGLRDTRLGLVKEILGEEMYAFVTTACTPWDAPLQGEPCPPPEIPSAEVYNLRQRFPEATQTAILSLPDVPEPVIPAGSNNWAVAGTHTADGGALIANDMHLGLQVPNIWYRVSLVYPGNDGEARITGASLPGAPLVVVGSNGHVAWGFTNSQTNTSDVVLLEPDPANPETGYLTPDGPRELVRHTETLRIKGAPDQTLEVLESRWGPVLRKDHQERRQALAWVAHHPEGLNMNLLAMEGARTVEEGLTVAGTAGIPAQNVVVGDSSGRIAWTLAGRLPKRFGFDGRTPTSWADGSRGWEGLIPPEEMPRIVDPENGRLWTANNRTLDGEALALLGDGTYAAAPRARQIRDGLLAVEAATHQDMLDIQLDDRAPFFEHWRDFLLEEVLTPEKVEGDSRRAALRQKVEEWDGMATVDSVGFRIVRGFRLLLLNQVGNDLIAECREIDKSFQFFQEVFRYETVLWPLVTQQPLHLLNPKYETWDEHFQSVIDSMVQTYFGNGGSLEEATWGARNTAAIRHPLSLAVPQLSGWLDMPRDPLPGGPFMPRVQMPSFGASERMVVSPGREDQGIFHMPGGQSGHPNSPHYRDGHEAWVKGEPTPFLPGETVHTLTLVPDGG